jgi:DNA-binding response OmpR family regulator
MTGKILFVSSDVFFWARVQGLAKSMGVDAVRIDDEAAMDAAFREGGVTRVIVDLGSRRVDALAWSPRWKSTTPAPQLIAFGSHVDEASFAAARAAGFDHVMANSRFNRELPDWLSGTTA